MIAVHPSDESGQWTTDRKLYFTGDKNAETLYKLSITEIVKYLLNLEITFIWTFYNQRYSDIELITYINAGA